MGAAALSLAGRESEIARRFAGEPAARSVRDMLVRRFNAPETSSLGRWFDAAAGLLGVSRRMSFEGQAAMLLEGAADRHGAVPADASLFAVTGDNELDLTALVMHLADERDTGRGAALFHATLVAALATWVAQAAQELDLDAVAAGGGCLLNALLARGLHDALSLRGIALYQAEAVPPNDGGLSLGQAWIAMNDLNGVC
jgi:hydrogenase maturation protein HypF